MIYPTEQSWISYTVLLINLGFSIFGSAISNQATKYAHERPHNFIRLVNEALTRLYLSYFSFFLALVIVLLNNNAGKIKIVVDIFIAIVTLLLWSVSLYANSIFSNMRYIEQIHGCVIKDNSCDKPANFRDFAKVCTFNMIIAAAIFIILTIIVLFSSLLQSE